MITPSWPSRSFLPRALPTRSSEFSFWRRGRFWALCWLAAVGSAFPAVSEYLDPLGLAAPKKFTAHRVSSAQDAVFNNADRKIVMPGETLVMADLAGPGMITHLWLTNADNEFAWPRLLRLRIYYDGAKTPSVDAPVGDFFGVGHGYERNLDSLMVNDSSSGRARNCYWPMPYRRSCRVTLTNEGQRVAPMVYYHVDYRDYETLPDDIRYFHAYYRQERPAVARRNYEFLSIRGTGHYVGTVLNVIQSQDSWFGEGDDLFYVDGAERPQIAGTGTEDYFTDAWGLRVANRLRTGTPVAEGERVGARLTGYRWHLEDTIPFEKSLWAGIEHSGWTSNPDGTVRTVFEERPDFFSSVAFWYQLGVNEGLAEPPYGTDRLPLGNATQISSGDLIEDVTTKLGKVSVLKEVDWGKDLLFFDAEAVGAQVNIPVDIPADGRYEILAMVAQFSDYGNYTALIDGRPANEDPRQLAPSETPAGPEVFNNYQPEMYVAMDRPLGWRQLTKGRHVVSFVCVGKDERSAGYKLGINDLVVENVPAIPVTVGPPQPPIPAAPVLPEEVFVQPAGAPLYRGVNLAAYRARIAHASPSELPSLLRAVGCFGGDAALALPDLGRALSDPNDEVRQAAAWALTQTGIKAASAVRELARALSDANPRVRTLAAVALRNVGATALAALPPLVQALDDPSDYVQARAADALGAMGPAGRAAVAPLTAKLKANQGPALVLASVADALGNLGAEAREALPVLRERLADPAFKAQRMLGSVRAAILKIEGKPVPAYR